MRWPSTPLSYPRMRAALGIALTLLSVIVAACAPPKAAPPATPAPAREYKVSGSGSALVAVKKLGEVYATQVPGIKITVESGTNTGGAITGVMNGALDLAAASRPLSEAEAAKPVSYHPFARDAAVFAIHRPTTVTGLSAAQLRDIYGGAVKNWAQVGGPDVPIVPLIRDADDALHGLVFMKLMAGRPVVDGAITLNSTGDMFNSLDGTPGAIGFIGHGYLAQKHAESVGMLAVDGVAPSPQTLEAGQYPWYLPFALVAHRDAPSDLRAFVEFASRNGPAVLRELGYAAP